jgi:hypothetical protein
MLIARDFVAKQHTTIEALMDRDSMDVLCILFMDDCDLSTVCTVSTVITFTSRVQLLSYCTFR